MPGQAELLVRRMKDSDNIDYKNDWKVITIFIGGNDLCDFCEDKVGTLLAFPYIGTVFKHDIFNTYYMHIQILFKVPSEIA